MIKTPQGFILAPEKKSIEVRVKTDLSKKCVCIVDTGLALHIAPLLAKSFGRVLYCLPDLDAFRKTNKARIGKGIPNVEKIDSLFDVVQVDQTNRIVDLFIFTDVSMIDWQRHLKALGYPVVGCFGAGMMETDKLFFYQTLESLKLPVSPYEVVNSIDELREALKKKKNPVYIKLVNQEYRGVIETFKCEDADAIDPVLDDIALMVGRYKSKIQFLIQDEIKSKYETGIDTLQTGDKHSNNPIVGIEGKNEWYIAKVVSDVPEVLKEYVDKTSPVMGDLGICCHRSTENRITESGDCYGIDETIRVPSPPGELFPELYQDGDYAQAMWDLGQGVVPNLTKKENYGVQIILKSSSLKSGLPVKVIYPKEIERFVKLTCQMIEEDGGVWVVPNDDDSDYLGSVVGVGNTLIEAEKKCREYAKQIKAHKISYEADVMIASKEAREKAKKFNVEF
jgi:hypothetical protein